MDSEQCSGKRMFDNQALKVVLNNRLIAEGLKNFDNELGQKNEKDGGKVPKEILLEIFGRIYQVFACTES